MSCRGALRGSAFHQPVRSGGRPVVLQNCPFSKHILRPSSTWRFGVGTQRGSPVFLISHGMPSRLSTSPDTPRIERLVSLLRAATMQ
jgi:hypothetical protein